MPSAHMLLHYGSEKTWGWDYPVLDTILIYPVEKPAYHELSPALLSLPKLLLSQIQGVTIFCWTKAGTARLSRGKLWLPESLPQDPNLEKVKGDGNLLWHFPDGKAYNCILWKETAERHVSSHVFLHPQHTCCTKISVSWGLDTHSAFPAGESQVLSGQYVLFQTCIGSGAKPNQLLVFMIHSKCLDCTSIPANPQPQALHNWRLHFVSS